MRIVLETGKPSAEVARDLGVHAGTLQTWVHRARARTDAEGADELSESEREELRRLREENARQHLAPRQDAVWGEGETMVPIGQHTANLRRTGQKNGLGKNPERATERAAQLTAIDPDRNWNCHGHWTGNATTAASRTWSTLAACYPASHPACSWTATTSANDSSSRNNPAPGHSCRSPSRNG